MSPVTYTNKTLTVKEKIIYTGDIHRFCYVYPLLMIIIGLILIYKPDISGNLLEESEELSTMQYYYMKAAYFVETKFYELKKNLPKELEPLFGIATDMRRYLVGFLLIGIGAGIWATSYIKRLSEEHAVTTRKVIFKKGWIAVDEKEISLERIEGVKIHQTMLDRMLNRGEVLVTGIGMEQIAMRNIAEPIKFRQAVLNAIERFAHHPQHH